jgi:hypothetical protein
MNRAERRRQIKEDERVIARGIGSPSLGAAQVMALMRVLNDRLEEARTVKSLVPLMTFFWDNMNAAARAAPRASLACGLGCSHCCHAWVSARAPEVLFVKSSISRKLAQEMRASIEAIYAQTGILGPEERDRMATPCPLLKNNSCQAYLARPATCRTAVSEDAFACSQAFTPGSLGELIPMPEFYIGMRRGYSLALAGALKRSGFPTQAYEFNAALAAAFSREDAEIAWLSGEPVFGGVQVEPGGETFSTPNNRRLYDAAWAGWS